MRIRSAPNQNCAIGPIRKGYLELTVAVAQPYLTHMPKQRIWNWEAAEVLEADADLYQRYPEPWVQLRLTGLRGKIAAARGDVATAEASFLAMREGFLQEGLGYDAAIVSMDLALLYLRQGRTAELKVLAKEMLPIFRSQDVHREAVAALFLFHEAVREEQVTVAFIRELAAYLDAARHDPSLRFRQRPEPSP